MFMKILMLQIYILGYQIDQSHPHVDATEKKLCLFYIWKPVGSFDQQIFKFSLPQILKRLSCWPLLTDPVINVEFLLNCIDQSLCLSTSTSLLCSISLPPSLWIASPFKCSSCDSNDFLHTDFSQILQSKDFWLRGAESDFDELL